MIENTLENKGKFFGIYAHQRVWGQHTYPKCLDWVDDIDYKDQFFNDACLLLKNISSITDEDAIEVANILGWSYLSDEAKIAQVRQLIDKHLNTQTNITFMEWTEVADYLRSKSYLLSWMGLTPDEIIERGWAKIKED